MQLANTICHKHAVLYTEHLTNYTVT